jgi:methionyl-tRNA formyltransferase
MTSPAGATRPRRFALTATDRYLGVFEAFVAAGWEPVKLFTVPTDGRLHSNTAVIAKAQALKIDIQLSRLDDAALAGLAALGCELLVVASYPWRIGAWQAHMPRAVNFHPSPLPRYRGPYPLVRAILDTQTRWGVSCHKLSAGFDRGDVLAQLGFNLSEQECHESLDLKTQIAAKRLAAEVAGDVDALWAEAQPQGAGSYAGLWTDADRTLDFTRTAAQLDRQLRAFGRFECLATINGVTVHVTRAVTWTEPHTRRPGSVVHKDGHTVVVACGDGFVAVLAWQLFGADTITGTGTARAP